MNAPPGIPGFHPLRDYPRSLYNAEIVRGRAVPNEITVVEAEFGLEEKDRARIPDEFKAVCDRNRKHTMHLRRATGSG